MARRSKVKTSRRYKGKTLTQRQYRARLSKYNKYLSSTTDTEPKTFKEWNSAYRRENFYRREYYLYRRRFDERKKSSTFGFRKKGIDYSKEVVKYDYSDFKEQYEFTRNTLVEEVEMGDREKVGSVINEMINDQAYELSRAKSSGIAKYLKENELELLKQKGLVKDYITDEKGKGKYIFKERRLELLIRQGQFIREEVGLWDEIKLFYENLTNAGYTSKEAKKQIGISYFNSTK